MNRRTGRAVVRPPEGNDDGAFLDVVGDDDMVVLSDVDADGGRPDEGERWNPRYADEALSLHGWERVGPSGERAGVFEAPVGSLSMDGCERVVFLVEERTESGWHEARSFPREDAAWKYLRDFGHVEELRVVRRVDVPLMRAG